MSSTNMSSLCPKRVSVRNSTASALKHNLEDVSKFLRKYENFGLLLKIGSRNESLRPQIRSGIHDEEAMLLKRTARVRRNLNLGNA